jgi:fructosamine-3-kinase
MTLTDTIAEAISRFTARPFKVARRSGVGGGCINATEVLEGDGQKYFVKLNDATRLDMFAAEADGLREILASQSIRAPRPIAQGRAGDRAFLVLEFLDLIGGRGGSQAELGRQLALMHRRSAARFGWWRPNTIGSTPQINTETADWVEFYRHHRLHYQLALAARHGGERLLALGERLLEALPAFFISYRPVPSLLHGDLWGGNHGTLADGTPVIFDPAVYFGDREADIAMTELFGGFGAGFYSAYREAWPLDPGYPVRRELYNLYHVLNHFNLFGGGYGAQARRMMETLRAELRG